MVILRVSFSFFIFCCVKMSEKILQMPSDDELVRYLMDAANEGAHDNIK